MKPPAFRSLIKHFCRLKSIWKMDNLPSNAMFRYVLIFSERKWLYFIICLSMIDDCETWIQLHVFFKKYVSVFALKQLVARILSNIYIWLLLKIQNNRGEKTSITRKQSVLTACENKQMHCLAIPFIVSVNSNKRVLHYWNIVLSE